jgi:ADP-dependent phosphofructokinase/glucokinase
MKGLRAEYARAAVSAPSRLAKAALFAFNSNVDLVRHAGNEPETVPAPPELKPFKAAVRKGESAELKVSRRTAGWLASSFEWPEARMGGQAGIMANAAAALGTRSYAYAPSPTRLQLSLFRRGVTVFRGAAKLEPVHYVTEFRRGSRLFGATAPAPNRIIASSDSPSFYTITREFREKSARLAPSLDCAGVSGFHNLPESVCAKRVGQAAELASAWKKANPGLRIHLELGHFSSPCSLKNTLNAFSSLADSLGMNELEFADSARALAIPQAKLAEEFPEIVVHRREGSSVLGYAPRKSARQAAIFGHALAAFKAGNGRDAGLAEVGRFAKSGLRFQEFGGIPAPAASPMFTVGLGDTFATGYALYL